MAIDLFGIQKFKDKLDEILRRLAAVEGRLDFVEQQVEQQMRLYGRYNQRTEQELRLMGQQIDDLLRTTESLIQASRNEDSIARTKRLLRRLRNNKTRIENRLAG